MGDTAWVATLKQLNHSNVIFKRFLKIHFTDHEKCFVNSLYNLPALLRAELEESVLLTFRTLFEFVGFF